jgi:hypothetical protein
LILEIDKDVNARYIRMSVDPVKGDSMKRFRTDYDREPGDKPLPLWYSLLPKSPVRLAYSFPDNSASSGRFARARQELNTVRRDLILLALTDPVAAAGRVRRIQRDMRRAWLPEVLARLHPVRPRLNLSND